MAAKRKPVSAPRTYAVLCVDDHVPGLTTRKALLESFGYSVETATSGAEALEAVARKSFDAVVLDYRMPGMDGLEVARRLKGRYPQLAIVLLSGYAGELPEELLRLATATVSKGSHPSALRDAVEKVLGPASRPKRAETTAAGMVDAVARTKTTVVRTRELVEEGKRAAARAAEMLQRQRKRRSA